MGYPMLLFTCAKGHSTVGTNITHEKKTRQLWALFWKRFMRKRNFLHRKGFFCIKGFPMLFFLCAKGHSTVGTNITHEKKTRQLWALFWKRFMRKRNFLHKKGFFCIKGLPNVTLYAYKRLFNCRFQYHTRKEN